jgi:hypothetical protein
MKLMINDGGLSGQLTHLIIYGVAAVMIASIVGIYGFSHLKDGAPQAQNAPAASKHDKFL